MNTSWDGSMNMKSWAWVSVVGLALGGCGGLSDVGEQESEKSEPFASVVVLNHPFTTDTSGKVVTRVRSGSEVFLSGKDSDGESAPVLSYEWSKLDQSSPADQVKLITRDKRTVSFSAPTVTQDVTLRYRLKVTDSKGKTAQKDVDVAVVAVPDNDRFLAYDPASVNANKLKVVALASRDVDPSELQTSGDVEFEIVVRRLVDYTTAGTDGPYLEVATEKIPAKWLASYGVGGTCTDLRNPVLQTARPSVDLDDILSVIDQNQPSLEPNPAFVDQFNLKLDVSINVTRGTLPAGVTPQVCVPDVASSPRATHVELTLAQLLGPATQTLDTPQSAAAYYKAIDPNDTRTTFLNWLKENGFIARDRTSFTWSDLETGSGAHAVYTNNYDLGFGRDMYARVKSCLGPTPTLGQPIDLATIGQCDVAAVVINYASLEGAAKKLNPVLAVAMEYATTPSLNRRIVQFYTFAPDSASGEFKRVSSANLDGRGEKYMPQVCTVCHGGTPGGLKPDGTYVADGDVNATFLPWDLDAFLYSDADGANSDRSFTDQPTRGLYTRAAQAESLRKLNQLAYLTYHDSTRANRYTLPRQLVEGWYGKQDSPARAFTSSTFNGAFTPAGWTANGVDGAAGTADDNPADAPRIYSDVFARNCRACHVAQAPAAEAAGIHLEIFETGTGLNTCDSQTTFDPTGQALEPQRMGSTAQLPLGCYRHFIDSPSLATRLSQSAMPFARLTLDRFWIASAESPARVLSRHLSTAGVIQAPNPQIPELALMPVATPILDSVTIDPPGDAGSELPFTTTFENDVVEVLRRGSLVRLDGNASFGSGGGYTWQLKSPAGEEVQLVGGTTAAPTARLLAPGAHTVRFAVGQSASLERSLYVPNWLPAARADGATASPSQTIEIDVLVNDRAVRADRPTVDFPLAANDPFVVQLCSSSGECGRGEVVTSSGARFSFTGASTNVVSFTPAMSGTEVLTYRLLDLDGDSSDATITVSVTAVLTASNLCVRVPSAQLSSPFSLPISGGTPSAGIPRYTVSFAPVLAGLAAVPMTSTYQFQAPVPTTSTSPIATGARTATYTAADSGVGPAQQTASAALSLKIYPVRSWIKEDGNDISNQVRTLITSGSATLAAPCSGCHSSGNPLILSSTDLQLTYNNLLARQVGTRRAVDLTTPASSLLLTCLVNPAPGAKDCPPNVAHGNYFSSTASSEYLALLRWIREGAPSNDTAAQYSCP
jgi:mono/diheme cytochrome c family protein